MAEEERQLNVQNPFAPQSDSNSYTNLKKRMFRQIQTPRVSDQVLEIVQKAFDEALKKENIVLSLPERKRMFSQILKQMRDDMLKKLEERSNST